MGLGTWTAAAAGPFGAFLSAQEEAQSLSLVQAGLEDEGAAEVAAFLGPSRHLAHLDLSGNCISQAGAAHLARALQMNGTLVSLVMRGTRLGEGGEGGLAALCRALTGNLTLRHLDLRQNGLSGALAAKCIGEMLQGNACLTHLELSWNPLDPSGGQVLLDHVGANTTLFDCQLTGCGIAAETLLAIANVLLRNRKARGADMQAGPYRALFPNSEDPGSACSSVPQTAGAQPPWAPRDLQSTDGQRTQALRSRLLTWQAARRGHEDRDASAQAQELLELLECLQGDLDGERGACQEVFTRTAFMVEGFQDRHLRYHGDVVAAREQLREQCREAEELRAIRGRRVQELEVLREACEDARSSLERNSKLAAAEEAWKRDRLAIAQADGKELAEHLKGLDSQSTCRERENKELRLRAEQLRSGVITLRR